MLQMFSSVSLVMKIQFACL